jgi:uncharacterized membrane protein (DUF485 family)
MTEAPGASTRGGGPGDGVGAGSDHHSDVDWVAAERSPEFRELIKRKKAFVLPATIFFLAWYFGFIILAGYAPDFMGESVYEGLTVGYCLALSQFLMVLVLGIWYLRKAEHVFDPLAEKAANRALETAEDDQAPARFSTRADDVTASTEQERKA